MTLNGVMADIVPHSVAFGADYVKVVGQIRQSNGHWSFKVTDFGTNRKLVCDFPLVIRLIVTYILSCTVSKLWLIIGQIFACDSRRPHLNYLASGDHLGLRISRRSLPHQKLV